LPYDRAADLVAAYYAATLTRDPTLDPEPDPSSLAAYGRMGFRLRDALVRPRRTVTIRCVSVTRQNRPKDFSTALATVRNRHLLVIRDRSGPVAAGIRLVVHLLVDIPMAQREGYEACLVYCRECRSLHEMPFHWLRNAPLNDVSDRREQFNLNLFGDPSTDEDRPLPDDLRSVAHLAFAQTTGTLDGLGTLFVTLPWWRAVYYREHFGSEPPHDAHFDRLIGKTHRFGTLEDANIIGRLTWGNPDAIAARVQNVENAHQ
jgi:hypothetical protein